MTDGSNGDWGRYHDGTPAKEQWWSEYERAYRFDNLPDNSPFTEFLATRGLTPADANAFGARWLVKDSRPTIIYRFPDGIKYRTITDPPKRWSPDGITWNTGILIPSEQQPPSGVIVAEGETDSMQLRRTYGPAWDILCLPSGARHIPDGVIGQCSGYAKVLAALDNDDAGNDGASKILERLPQAVRMLPPANDWCAAALETTLVPDPLVYTVERPALPIYTAREIVQADFGTYDDNHWFSDGVVPVGGQVIIHAPLKSFKSVILLDMVRALTTGTSFAGAGGYEFLQQKPARVLMFQMEIRPEAFQRRLMSFMVDMTEEEKDAFMTNAHFYKIGDRQLPRLKITQKDFRGTVIQGLEAADANVVVFDPLQRLTGEADLNQANELEALLDFFAELQNAGVTVLSCHHNNKANVTSNSAYAMAGSQRFGADADSICTITYDPKIMLDDNNPERRRQRNFGWTQRDGAAMGRSIEVRPNATNPELMNIRFGPTIRELEIQVDPTIPIPSIV